MSTSRDLYTYNHTHAHIHLHIYTYRYTCILTFTTTYTFAFSCTYTYTFTYTYTYIHAYVHVCVCMYICMFRFSVESRLETADAGAPRGPYLMFPCPAREVRKGWTLWALGNAPVGRTWVSINVRKLRGRRFCLGQMYGCRQAARS